MRANRNALMSRSAASNGGERATSGRPAVATASGLATPAVSIRRRLSPIASSMKRVMTRRVSSWMTRGRLEARMAVLDLGDHRGDEGNGGADVVKREQARPQAVVDVVRVVGDVVGERRRLRLEAREARQVEPLAPIVGEDRRRHAALAVAPDGRPEASRSGPLCLTRPASVVSVRFRPSKSA